MFWVIKFDRYDDGRSLQWWKEDGFQGAYNACVAQDQTKWHIKMKQAVRAEVEKADGKPVMVAFNDVSPNEIKTTFYIVENQGEEPVRLWFLEAN
jgi:hypothetical protein